MSDPLDLDELNTIADMADFLGVEVKMSPAQFRTVLNELRATREEARRWKVSAGGHDSYAIAAKRDKYRDELTAALERIAELEAREG